jgi:regulator of sigma E protease
MIEITGVLWTVLFFLLAIGPLVFVHEMGHYLVGRWCGVKAEVFSIGFGQEVRGWTDRRGTRWKVGWLPLGGYVRFAGDMSPASEPSAEWKALPPEERTQTFQAKALWQRAAIVLAGPVTNFLLAILLYMGIFAFVGEQQTPNIIGAVQPKSAAAAAGFKVGDRVTAIDGRAIVRFTDIGRYVELRPKQLMTFDVVRGGAPIKIVAAPAEDRTIDRFGNKASRGLMGLGSVKPMLVDLSVAELPSAAVRQTFSVLQSMVDGLGQLITGRRSLSELGGPLMIANYSGQTASLGVVAFIAFIALISINLGFINLLPIPTLDGGHLFFYAIEAVIRRPVGVFVQEWAFRSGFLLLMALMLFATFNDLASFGLWTKLTGLIG